jgi:hypothetical protein
MMILNHTTGEEDAILTDAKAAGGIASDAAAVAIRLDGLIASANDKIQQLESELFEAKQRIGK